MGEPSKHDVVVVGAVMAGLSCALRLRERGLRPRGRRWWRWNAPRPRAAAAAAAEALAP